VLTGSSIEVKLTEYPTLHDIRHLENFIAEFEFNNMKKIFFLIVAFLLFQNTFLLIEVVPDTYNCSLAEGITLIQKINKEEPLVINFIKINFKTAAVYLQTALAGNDFIYTKNNSKGRETLQELVIRKEALAGINADYFPYTGDPLSLMIRDSELISESMPNRVAMAITLDQKIYFDTFITNMFLSINENGNLEINGINRTAKKNELIVLTPTFGDLNILKKNYLYIVVSNVNLPVQVGKEVKGVVTSITYEKVLSKVPSESMIILVGEEQIPDLKNKIKVGDKIILISDLKASINDFDTSKIAQAIGGGPWLIKNGQKYIDYEKENFKLHEFVNKRHPRTAIGTNSDGDLYFITVDGRSKNSKGVSLSELADILLGLNITNAINLDGGGSTSLVIKNIYINQPSDKTPREIANAILIYAADASEIEPSESMIEGNQQKDLIMTMPETNLVLNQTINLTLPEDAEKENLLWGTQEGKFFVSQKGELMTIGIGSGTAIAISKSNKKYYFPFKIF
jgi:exopolysaccharide biosynthesis protein